MITTDKFDLAKGREQADLADKIGAHGTADMLRAACVALEEREKERDDAVGFKAWIRKKLEGSTLCERRTDGLAETDSEIFGWMHVVVANAQSWVNMLPMIDKRNREQRTEIDTLARENERLRDTLEGLSASRANAIATYLGGYKEPRDINIFRHGMETVFNIIDSVAKETHAVK